MNGGPRTISILALVTAAVVLPAERVTRGDDDASPSPTSWSFDVSCVSSSKLMAADAAPFDEFGRAVAVSGPTAVIGAALDDDDGVSSGAVYVFDGADGVWTQSAKLTASDAEADDQFGSSVAIAGDTLVAGAAGDDNGAGAVYVFDRAGDAWTETLKLVAPDGMDGDRFGISVSMSGDTIVVGADLDDDNGNRSGSAHVLERSKGVWTYSAKLKPSDGSIDDNFGRSVGVSGDRFVAGAWGDRGSTGAAYVFERSAGVWTEITKLVADDGADDDLFGRSVAISGDTIVVGARWDDDRGDASGAAYAIERGGGAWSQQDKIVPSDGAASAQFGYAVTIDGDRMVIGTWRGPDGTTSGSAYVYDRADGAWEHRARVAPDTAAFGTAVSLSGDTLLAGAFRDDERGAVAGAAYAITLPCTDCAADLDGSRSVDFGDLLALLSAWGACPDCPEDLDGNDAVDFADLLLVLGAWGPCD